MNIKNIDKLIKDEIIPVIVYNELPSNYKIQRQNKNIKIAMKEFTENNKKIKQKFHNYLNDFVSKLTKNLNNCNFDNFCKNVKSVKFEEKYSKIKGSHTYGAYFTRKNKIELYNKNFENCLDHELLHMASNKKINNKLILDGFCIIDFKKWKKYGVFLNEGYTEHLSSKYFKSTDVYKTQIGFIKLLEKIIGIELMKKMYFNADLKGLIEELMKYNNTKKEVLEFILNTDIIHKYRCSLTPVNRFKLKRATLKANAFLVKSYYAKLLKEKLTFNKTTIELTKFMNELIDVKVGFKSNYYYMDDARNYYNNVIEKKKKLNL